MATTNLIDGHAETESGRAVAPLQVKSITVVIPTCHRNDALALCLEKLAPGQQTLDFETYEVVVSDDGSRSTAETMLRDRFPWAKWTAGPRKGPAANRNHGASVGTGKWIAFTDDDCIPTTGWLAGYLEQAADGCQVYEGRTICTAGFDGFWNAAPTNETGGLFWSCNLMVLRQTFEELGGFDEGFPHPAWEDVEFSMRVKQQNIKTAMARTAVVDHPPAPRQRGRKYAPKWEGLLLIWHKHRKDYATPWHLIRHVAAIRGGELRDSKGLDKRLMLARAAIYETIFVALSVHGWNKRLKMRFA